MQLLSFGVVCFYLELVIETHQKIENVSELPNILHFSARLMSIFPVLMFLISIKSLTLKKTHDLFLP